MTTKQVEVKLSVGALMQIKGPLERGAKQCEEFARRADKSLRKLEDLKGPIKAIESYKKLDKQWKDSRKNLDKARQHYKDLHAEINKGGKITKRQRAEYERAQRAMERAERAMQKHGTQVASAKRDLDGMGISVRNLAGAENRLQTELSQTESHINRNSEAWKRRAESARTAQAKLQKLEEKRNAWARRGAIGAATAYAAKRTLGAGAQRVYGAAEYDHKFTQFGIKAELGKAQVDAVKGQVKQVAKAFVLDKSQIAEGVFAAAEAGMSADDIKDTMGTWGKVAKTANAGMGDLVKLTDAHIRNLQIPASQIEKALAAQYAIGDKGKFEMDDMARYGAPLGAKYEALKFTGMDAVSSMSAALQVSMNSTGDAGIAANNLSNFLSALAKEDTQKRFKEAGLDIESEWKDALKYGVDPLLHMAKVIEAKGGTDQFRLGELFGDEQARSFALALVGNIEEYQAYKKAGQGGENKLNQDTTKVLNDPLAKMDRLQLTMKSIAADMAERFLPTMVKIADAIQPHLDKLAAWMAENDAAVDVMINVGGGIIAATGAVGGLTAAVATAGLAKALTQGGWIVLTQGLDGLIERYGKVERGAGRAARAINGSQVGGTKASGSRIGGVSGAASSVFVVGMAVAAAHEIGSALENSFLKPFSDNFKERAKREQENLDKTNSFLGNLNRLVIESIKGKEFADELLGPKKVIKSADVVDMADAPAGETARAQQSRLAATLATTADNIQQADVGAAMAGQAMAIKRSPIDVALREKADQIRAVRFSVPSGAAKPVAVDLPGRAKGGPVKAGHAYMVGEDGPEPFVPGQDGAIIPNQALRGAGGQAGGVSIHAPITIHAATGMDEGRIATLVQQKISEVMQRALAESYQSAEYA